MTPENHRCAICAAEFGSSKDLVQHEKEQHSHHGARKPDASDARPGESGEPGEPGERGEPGRQNREFSRRNLE